MSLQMVSIGATEVAAPSGFANTYQGTLEVHHFTKNANRYTVYIFPFDEVDPDAGLACTRLWNSSTGVCPDPGGNCKYELNVDSSRFEIICCE